MPNDAKLGLVVGMGLVIAVAVIFFRKELPGQASLNGPTATMSRPVALPTPNPGSTRHVPGRFIARNLGENE